MTLVSQESGCKVGWEIYDNEAEAIAAASDHVLTAQRKWAQGYDFGYCVPGEIRHVESHSGYDGREVWIVTTP